MKGTDSKQADNLYRGIIVYFSNMSGLDITSRQIIQRDKFVNDGAIICDDEMDSVVLSLQDDFVSSEGNVAEQNAITESVIMLLAGEETNS